MCVSVCVSACVHVCVSWKLGVSRLCGAKSISFQSDIDHTISAVIQSIKESVLIKALYRHIVLKDTPYLGRKIHSIHTHTYRTVHTRDGYELRQFTHWHKGVLIWAGRC